MKYLLIPIILIALISCNKNKCQTCTKAIGGVAGNITTEERTVCDDDEITNLENSSSGTTVWTCE